MKKKYIKWILIIIWMIIIYYFSNKPAIESDRESYFVINLLNFFGVNLNSIFGKLANFAVRKTAHFTEYFIFGLLLYNAFTDKFDVYKAALYSIVIVFLYASTDEIHQLFIPGRTGRIRDVIIDSSGGATSLIFCLAINKLKSIKNRF